jgi:short-subunit dehydrogenase
LIRRREKGNTVSAPVSQVAALFFAALLAGCSAMRGHEASPTPRTVVITGASSGFGRGVALELAARGDNVVLAARRTELLEEVARTAGSRALVVTTDVSQPDQVERLAGAALEKFGRIDVWINDAGVGALGRFEDIPLADHARIIDVNLNGVLYGSHFAMKHFRNQGRGTLINIASVAGRVPFPYYASYVASKHAVVGFGAALNQELRLNGEKNIHVVTINPFAADTPFFDHAANYTGHSPRSVLLDPPEKVVAAIVRATDRPRPEINVGWKANGAVASARMARTPTHALVAKIIDRAQMEKAPPADSTAGAIYQPEPDGVGVDGGVRRRMAQEDCTAGEASACREAVQR